MGAYSCNRISPLAITEIELVNFRKGSSIPARTSFNKVASRFAALSL